MYTAYILYIFKSKHTYLRKKKSILLLSIIKNDRKRERIKVKSLIITRMDQILQVFLND